MVDTGNDDAVANFEQVGAVVKDHLDAALNDKVEVEGVGVVHGGFRVRGPVDDEPLRRARSYPEVPGVRTSGGSGPWARLGLVQGVDGDGTGSFTDLDLSYDTGPAIGAGPGDQASHATILPASIASFLSQALAPRRAAGPARPSPV